MSTDQSLDSLGERRLVTEILGRRYGSSPAFGDDCALVPLEGVGDVELVATTDPCPAPLVATLGWDDLFYTGWLLATINLSDLAAAGADPVGLLVSYVLPGNLGVVQFERLLSGVDDCCALHGTRVLGGNLGDGPRVHLTATAIGRCRRGQRFSRRGVRAGDVLLLVGSPGYLWATALVCQGHASLPGEDQQALFERALRPRAQTGASRALAAGGLVRAAIDISDGLYAGVRTLCDANGLGARLAPDVHLDAPVAAVCRQADVDAFALAQLWGDWTLLVAVAPDVLDEARSAVARSGSDSHVLGTFTEAADIVLDQSDGTRPWTGVESERFTPSSWRDDLVSTYITQLRHHTAP
jgi:thiamine-monophosphate kinase